MRKFIPILFILALVLPAMASAHRLSRQMAEKATARIGQADVRTGEVQSYKVLHCWARHERGGCAITEFGVTLPPGFPASTGDVTLHTRVTLRHDRAVACLKHIVGPNGCASR